MKRKKKVGNMPHEDAEQLCKQKNGNFERQDGNIFIVWHECEAAGCKETIDSTRKYCEACGGHEDRPLKLNEGPNIGGATP